MFEEYLRNFGPIWWKLTDYFHPAKIIFYIQFYWPQNSEYKLVFKIDVELLHLNVATRNNLHEEICAALWIKYV